MRVSDWSSDVCSSDLLAADRILQPFRPDGEDEPEENSQGDENDEGPEAVALAELPHRPRVPSGSRCATRMPAEGASLRDRKSAVSGKSVSVRVDLGGRRFIKKKTKTQPTEPER